MTYKLIHLDQNTTKRDGESDPNERAPLLATQRLDTNTIKIKLKSFGANVLSMPAATLIALSGYSALTQSKMKNFVSAQVKYPWTCLSESESAVQRNPLSQGDRQVGRPETITRIIAHMEWNLFKKTW